MLVGAVEMTGGWGESWRGIRERGRLVGMDIGVDGVLGRVSVLVYYITNIPTVLVYMYTTEFSVFSGSSSTRRHSVNRRNISALTYTLVSIIAHISRAHYIPTFVLTL